MVNRGLTLIEILISLALMSIMTVGTIQLYQYFSNNYNNIQNNITRESQLQAFVGEIQKYLAPGDIRYMAFSGNVPIGDKETARFLVPLPGTCGDLSTAGCTNDTALMYMHVYKDITPSLTGICFLDSRHLLIDTHNPNYGLATFASGSFNVTSSSAGVIAGQVLVPSNTILAVGAAPLMTLWLVAGLPVSHPVTYLGGTTFVPAMSSDCINNLQPGPDVAGLVSVPVNPFVITQFTQGVDGTATPGTPPYRVYSPNIRVLGRRSGAVPIAGIFDCGWVASVFSCNPKPVSSVPGVSQFRIFHNFKISFGSPPISLYDVIGPGMTVSTTCSLPGCRALSIANPALLPVLYDNTTHAETYTTLDAAGFSLLKQEMLNRLSFRFNWPDGTPERSADVIFP